MNNLDDSLAQYLKPRKSVQDENDMQPPKTPDWQRITTAHQKDKQNEKTAH